MAAAEGPAGHRYRDWDSRNQPVAVVEAVVEEQRGLGSSRYVYREKKGREVIGWAMAGFTVAVKAQVGLAEAEAVEAELALADTHCLVSEGLAVVEYSERLIDWRQRSD